MDPRTQIIGRKVEQADVAIARELCFAFTPDPHGPRGGMRVVEVPHEVLAHHVPTGITSWRDGRRAHTNAHESAADLIEILRAARW